MRRASHARPNGRSVTPAGNAERRRPYSPCPRTAILLGNARVRPLGGTHKPMSSRRRRLRRPASIEEAVMGPRPKRKRSRTRSGDGSSSSTPTPPAPPVSGSLRRDNVRNSPLRADARGFHRPFERDLRRGRGLRRFGRQGPGRRDRKGHGADRHRPEDRGPRRAEGIHQSRPRRRRRASATRSRSISSGSRTRSAKPSSRATRRGARRAGSSSSRRSRRTRRSTASSSTRSRAASPSISTAPWPSCRAARSTSARCATSRR